MAKSRSGGCFRFLLVVFNFFVFVAGGVLTGFGIYLSTEISKIGFIGLMLGMPLFTLILGLVVIFFAIIGCIAACKLNGCMIKTYLTFMVLLIISEIVCGSLTIVLKDPILRLFEEEFIHYIGEIEGGQSNTQLMNRIKSIQINLSCCGANGPSDWEDPDKRCCASGDTCFVHPSRGCIEAAQEIKTTFKLPIGIIIVILAAIEIGAVVSAASLTQRIR